MKNQATKPQAPLYVFTFDISDNKERNKVNNVLQEYGFRVQKSVYECHLTRGNKKHLLEQLKCLNISTGHIRCYGVNSKVTKIGNVPDDIDDEFIYYID